MPTVETPDGTRVPLLSADGADYFLAGELFGYFFPDWLIDPLVDGWYVELHPDDSVVA